MKKQQWSECLHLCSRCGIPKCAAVIDPFETRSKRVQLLMRPTFFSTIRYIANMKHMSIDNLIESILFDFIMSEKNGKEETNEKETD